MPAMTDHHASHIVKALIIGDSGSGKTGAIPAIINEGQVDRIGILDFDNGLDIMLQFLKPELRSQVFFEILTDKMKANPEGTPFPSNPQAFSKAMKLLDRFKGPDYDLGPVSSWGPRDLLLIDSMTMMGRAAIHYQKKINNKLMERDWEFYGGAMEMQEGLLELLYSDSIKCNVIVTAHITLITPKKRIEVQAKDGRTQVQTVDTGDATAFPSALGNKLPPRVGRFFNAVLRIRSRGHGASLKKIIETVSDEEIELKNPFPLVVPREIPLDGPKGGLATYFRLCREAAAGPEVDEPAAESGSGQSQTAA